MDIKSAWLLALWIAWEFDNGYCFGYDRCGWIMCIKLRRNEKVSSYHFDSDFPMNSMEMGSPVSRNGKRQQASFFLSYPLQ
jgi:hypothetical protein